MSITKECSNCDFRSNESLCLLGNGPFYGKRIGPDDSCKDFKPNQTVIQLYEANDVLFKADTKENYLDALRKYEKVLGLNPTIFQKMWSNMAAGECHFKLIDFMSPTPSVAEQSLLPDFIRGMDFLEKSFEVDRKNDLGFFRSKKPYCLTALNRYDLMSTFSSDRIKREKGAKVAIDFLNERIEKMSRITDWPLIVCLHDLITLNMDMDNMPEAKRLMRVILDSESIIKDGATELQNSILNKVKGFSSALENPEPSKEKNGCFIATAVYGNADAPAVLIFKLFRDQYLKTNTIGRSAMRIYYFLSPTLADFIKKHKIASSIVRFLFLDPIAFLINQCPRMKNS